jgi:hypothetical protein
MTKYFSVINSRKIKRAGHVELTGKKRCVYRILVEKPEGKRTIGRSRFR